MISWKYVAQLVTSGVIQSLDSEGKRILFENIERMAAIADMAAEKNKGVIDILESLVLQDDDIISPTAKDEIIFAVKKLAGH